MIADEVARAVSVGLVVVRNGAVDVAQRRGPRPGGLLRRDAGAGRARRSMRSRTSGRARAGRPPAGRRRRAASAGGRSPHGARRRPRPLRDHRRDRALRRRRPATRARDGAVAAVADRADRQAGLLDPGTSRRHRRVLRLADGDRSAGSPTCRTTGTGCSRDRTPTTGPSSWRRTWTGPSSEPGAVHRRRARLPRPRPAHRAGLRVARRGARRRRGRRHAGCSARSATSPSTTATGPS